MFHVDDLLKMKPELDEIDNISALPNERIGNSPYVVLKAIHRSDDSFVYLVRNTITEQKMIVKEFYPMIDFEYLSVPIRLKRQLDQSVVLVQDSVESIRVFNNLKKYYNESATYIKKIDCKHVVKVVESFEMHNTVYVALEYLPYPTLEELIERKNLLPRQAMGIFDMILSAVQHIHNKGFTIKVLSPSNIYITDTHVIIGDFNPLKRSYFISHNTTDKYISPEILRGEILTESTDCYSLGRILEYLMGHIGYYTGNKQMQNNAKFKPTIIEYLLKVTLKDNAIDRIQSIEEIVAVLNRNVVHKGKKIEVAKMFLAALLVIIAVVSLRKSGVLAMIKWPESEVIVEQAAEVVEDEFTFVTKRTEFDFGMSQNIRWIDPKQDGMYHVKLMTNEGDYTIVTEGQCLDLKGFALNPGKCSIQVENANMDVISMDFEVLKRKGMKYVSRPEVSTPQYAFYTNKEQVISWESEIISQVFIYDLNAALAVINVMTEQKKLDLTAFDLPKGLYLITLQNSVGKDSSDFNHIQVEVYNEGEIAKPIVEHKDELNCTDLIKWAPLEQGDINIKFVHSSGNYYEKFCPAIEGQMALDQDMLSGDYQLYITYTVDDASSEVVEKRISIVD
jgi:serine/threonine protein kinase